MMYGGVLCMYPPNDSLEAMPTLFVCLRPERVRYLLVNEEVHYIYLEVR